MDGVPPLTKNEAQKYLDQTIGWELLDKKSTPIKSGLMKIRRKFTFKDFQQALDFVNKVGRLAESEDHHPDIFLHNYKKVDLTLYTHAIGGLSTNDFILAAKINKIV